MGLGSGGDELVPLADHVLVFVHHRVPAGDGAHAVVERAAVAHFAGLASLSPVGLVMSPVAFLALEPVAPFVLGHEGSFEVSGTAE
jgi:hypothetical protein